MTAWYVEDAIAMIAPCARDNWFCHCHEPVAHPRRATWVLTLRPQPGDRVARTHAVCDEHLVSTLRMYARERGQ